MQCLYIRSGVVGMDIIERTRHAHSFIHMCACVDDQHRAPPAPRGRGRSTRPPRLLHSRHSKHSRHSRHSNR